MFEAVAVVRDTADFPANLKQAAEDAAGAQTQSNGFGKAHTPLSLIVPTMS